MKHHFITRTALATLMLAGAAIGVAETASAADLAPLPVAPRFSWTGCYVGGYIGFATANTWQSTDLGSSGPVPAPLFSPIGANPWSYSENTSFVGGGNAGCNYQLWSGPANSPLGGLVVGVEGEGGYMSLSGSARRAAQHRRDRLVQDGQHLRPHRRPVGLGLSTSASSSTQRPASPSTTPAPR